MNDGGGGREVSSFQRHLAGLSAQEKVRVVARLGVQRSALYARYAEALVALRSEPCMSASEAPVAAAGVGTLVRDDVVEMEVAAALSLTLFGAGQDLKLAVALDERMFTTMRLLRAGVIDWDKVRAVARVAVPYADHIHSRALAEGLSPREAEAAARAAVADLEAMALAKVEKLTCGQLQRKLNRALKQLDPDYAEERRLAGARSRSVQAPSRSSDDPEGRDMQDLFAHLPAPEAQAVWATVDAYARAMRAAGDERTLEQLRADTLTHLILRGHPPAEIHVAGPNPAGTPDTPPTPTAATAPDDTSAEAKSDAATGATSGATSGGGTDAARGAGTGAASGAREDASPRAAHEPAPTIGAPAAVPSAFRAGAPDERPATAPMDWSAVRGFDQYGLRANVEVVVSLETLMGLNDDPGHLAGHGPITAQTARDIAFKPGGTWRRLVIDERGDVIDRSSQTYAPPERLKQFIRARDRTCRTPWCDRPAATCDVDHVRPWPGGATAASNLQCKCRRCHRLKHEGHWKHEVLEDGTIRMVSPAGMEYLSEPVDLRPLPLPRPRSRPQPAHLPDRGDPPF